jgi:inorganic pyrophosphatase
MLDRLPARHRKRLNVVIETPRGSRNKLCYDHRMRLMRLGKQLPAGAVFPFDYGFVPSTRAADGDPLDALVLLDSPTFPGCLVRARLLGVVEGRQTGRSGRTVDNPRLIAVATKSTEFDGVTTLRDLPTALVDEIVHFFVSYNAGSGKKFEPTARGGRRAAEAIVSASTTRKPKRGRAARGIRPRSVGRLSSGRALASAGVPLTPKAPWSATSSPSPIRLSGDGMGIAQRSDVERTSAPQGARS